MNKISKSQVGANLRIMVLLQLNQKKTYGYAITQEIKTLTEKRMNLQEGVMYPILAKMENEELIKSSWELENGRPRRYYQILEKGRIELQKLLEERDFMYQAVNQLISSTL